MDTFRRAADNKATQASARWNNIETRELSAECFQEASVKSILVCAAALGIAFASPANAKGCIKGAIVGGIAGHVAGHHGAVGAVAGCVIGRRNANKADRERHEREMQRSGQREHI
jgi:outer membrane lipoprotein SlyB